ncbi:trna-dihydrouridine synthase [Holotrichia oblita]|uniref:Trna-dihydrouridine synthase n=1 Tax=Holotrichia oblita TaxID=644536 RepID=A0ACB9TTV4_HOLOL|nr:trna-dihydrouridine synthase [Holotrichia oblita]
MEFWKNILGAPVNIVAPMVDASELPWRILSRRHGAHLCYTPMLHSAVFCKDSKYRKEALASCEEDKPLIVQFCGNDAQIMLEAALLAQDQCSAIDINLGCPQAIAKRGHYGAFLQDEWLLLTEIISTLSKSLKIPVTCKIRVFEDINKTVEYAKMLEKAGCKMLTVHGNAVKIPVISNGNIQCIQDLKRCLEYTEVVGVMTAEGNLYNPALFEGRNPPAWELAIEYLDLVEKYPCPFSYIRGHLFKLFHHILSLPENNELRIQLGSANTLHTFRSIVVEIRDMYLPYHEGKLKWEQKTTEEGALNIVLPPWLCQPYVRIPPDEHLKKIEDHQDKSNDDLNKIKRQYEDSEGNQISRKRMKKLRRISRRPPKPENCVARSLDICLNCVNPLVRWSKQCNE